MPPNPLPRTGSTLPYRPPSDRNKTVMSWEFSATCPAGKPATIDEIIGHLKSLGAADDVYGPFEEAGGQKTFVFPGEGVRGFSIRAATGGADALFDLRQNILPILQDWKALLSALQFLARIPGCVLAGEGNEKLTPHILEQWKSEDDYYRLHLFEAEGIIEELGRDSEEYTIPTYPYDLIIERTDIDLKSPIREQFGQIIRVLLKQVSHFKSCHQPSIMVLQGRGGVKKTACAWVPSLPSLLWEVDLIFLGADHLGEDRTAAFRDILDALGSRVKCVGSMTAGRNRYELPALRFSNEEDGKIKKKILALKSAG